ncbi:hypothetical protein [Rhodopirellula bahusiensis]|uniref:hypothetical protein n=1 Tax=Rhodopirellula bahusiensis TaxID=2014065 RepID=UPI0032636128
MKAASRPRNESRRIWNVPREVKVFDRDAVRLGRNGQFLDRQLPRWNKTRPGRAIEIALRDRVALKSEVIDGIACWASVRDPHLLRPRLECDVERVRQQSRAHAVSAIEILIEHGIHGSLRRATKGFYDTALNEASDV